MLKYHRASQSPNETARKNGKPRAVIKKGAPATFNNGLRIDSPGRAPQGKGWKSTFHGVGNQTEAAAAKREKVREKIVHQRRPRLALHTLCLSPKPFDDFPRQLRVELLIKESDVLQPYGQCVITTTTDRNRPMGAKFRRAWRVHFLDDRLGTGRWSKQLTPVHSTPPLHYTVEFDDANLLRLPSSSSFDLVYILSMRLLVSFVKFLKKKFK